MYRKVCGWRRWEDALKAGWTGLQHAPPLPEPIAAAGAEGACSALVKRSPPPVFRCENRSYDDPSGPLDRCGGWQEYSRFLDERFTSERSRLEVYNSQQALAGFSGLPQASDFDVELQSRWAAQSSGERWEQSLAAVDADGAPISEDRVRPADPIVLQAVEFERADSTPAAPAPERWLQELRRKAAAGEQTHGWQTFIMERMSALAVQSRARSPLVFDEVDPFAAVLPNGIEGGGLAPAAFGEGEAPLFDYDLDCVPDSACSRREDIPDSERLIDRVREEAAKQYGAPEAADKSIRAIVKRESFPQFSYLGTAPRTAVGEILEKLHPCAPLAASCRYRRTGAEPQFLGTAETLPEACRSREFVDCTAEPLGGAVERRKPETIVRTDAARAAGYREIARILPGSALRDRCTAAGCAEITVNIEPADPQRPDELLDASVQVSYRVPLTFPLDAMLGASEATVSAAVRERIETSAPAVLPVQSSRQFGQ